MQNQSHELGLHTCSWKEGGIVPLILHRGEMWARNDDNIERILGSKEGGQGIYPTFPF
jgi:peptidoglycan/xylan/chitin deacetylase (PgdA/CDA1 family)